MPITLNQHRFGITQSTIALFSDDAAPQLGLSAFFPQVIVPSKEVSIEVERNNQLIAVDVQRGRGSNRNIFSKSTEKIFVPPYFSEKFDFTSLQNYDVTFGQGVAPSEITASMLINSAAKKTLALKYKIQRAIAKQHADILQTGVVTLINGDSIDYKRQAGSMPVLSGTNMWSAQTTADPSSDLVTGANFLREQGLSSGTAINVIFGAAAFSNFLKNANIQKEAAIFTQIKRVNIGMPQFDNTTGLVFQGQYGSGDFLFNLWTFNAWYKDTNNNVIKYLATNNVIMVPDDFEGRTAFASVPMVMGDQTTGQFVGQMEGDFFFHDLIDQEKKTWDFVVESAPLAVPVSVDRMYTIQTTS